MRFLGPSRAPIQKADMGSRAPEAPERAAQKEQPTSQPGNANAAMQRFVAGVARARAPEGPRTNGKKARTAQRASQPQQKQNGQNNSPPLSTAVFDGIYSVL